MSAHTLGPWTYVGNSWQYTTIYAANGSPVAQLDLEDWGVNEDNQSELEAEQEQAARLIAAAPELLEALERIARPHDCGCKPCTGACRNQLALEITLEEIQELARAAIAKAKGESA